ncbi:unnamed protein product [Peronospora belbahrii]|uniref:Uncharacterized protein n=1 Tax=Peronospora belbahrii TaxID=622444 RepID=A0ABN8D0L4_9STRA|nr:unnamed protein product [Peronospora belbahrii]
MLRMVQDAADINTTTLLKVAVNLLYTSTSLCPLDSVVPSSSDTLATSLLPLNAVFRGNIQLSNATNGSGCAMYLTIKGTISFTSDDYQDIFDVVRNVHQQLTEQLSSKGLENVVLTQTEIALDNNKLFTVLMTSGELKEAPKSVVTVHKGACKELLNTLQGGEDEKMLLPGHVDISILDAAKMDDEDEDVKCVVDLEVAALVSPIGADTEAFQLLKTVDEKMESFFAGQLDAALASANVRLYAASTDENETLYSVVETGSANAFSTTNMTFNLPSFKEALGIFALVAVLVAMMVGVVIQKKRNDRCSRKRYERADRAAQIHRVSISMSRYDKKQDQEYDGEEDSLL